MTNYNVLVVSKMFSSQKEKGVINVSHAEMSKGSEVRIDWFQHFGKLSWGRRQPIWEVGKSKIITLPFKREEVSILYCYRDRIVGILKMY